MNTAWPWLGDGVCTQMCLRVPIHPDLLGTGVPLGWRPYNQTVDELFHHGPHLKTSVTLRECISESQF